VKNDGAARTAPAKNGGSSEDAPSEPAARPTESSILQQNPFSLPIGAIAPKAQQGAVPTLRIPSDAHSRKGNATPCEGLAQKIAIVINSIGWRIEPSQKRNHGLVNAEWERAPIFTPDDALSH
jgi:hypothetical protein